MTVADYLDLITAEFRQKEKFTEMVGDYTSLPVRVQDLIKELIPLFDVDTAVGDQLDIVGQWVGVSRRIAVPISNVYFSWDGAASLGWDYGTWRGENEPANITLLPDDAYRTLIRARIAANRWDGTTNGAYEIWDEVFPQITILIQDFQNMSYALALVGGVIDSLTLALITGGYIPLKPEGVLVTAYYIPVNDGPLFAWDADSDYLAGWDEGSWVQEVPPT